VSGANVLITEDHDGDLPEQKEATMANKHVNDDKNANSQKAQQAAARKAAQAVRGSNAFKSGSNVHNGASKSQSGQPKK
jgi:hypothetical protein